MMYVVRLRRPDGRVARRMEFPDLGEALRHMDGFVLSRPERVSELYGTAGVLFRYEPPGRSTVKVVAAR